MKATATKMKVIMKNLAKTITKTLIISICLLFTQSVHPGLFEYRKIGDAVPASAPTVALFKEIFKDYGLNPNDYQILAYNDFRDLSPAIANSIKKCISINQHVGSYDSWDTSKYNNLLLLYLGYHEVGHLKDMTMQKEFKIRRKVWLENFLSTGALAAFGHKLTHYSPFEFQKTWIISTLTGSTLISKFIADKADPIVLQEAREAGERRADSLACKQLLNKEWGVKAIGAYLMNSVQGLPYANLYKSIGHDNPAEIMNITNVLKNNGYDVKCNIENNDVTMHIMKNDAKISFTKKIQDKQIVEKFIINHMRS